MFELEFGTGTAEHCNRTNDFCLILKLRSIPREVTGGAKCNKERSTMSNFILNEWNGVEINVFNCCGQIYLEVPNKTILNSKIGTIHLDLVLRISLISERFVSGNVILP